MSAYLTFALTTDWVAPATSAWLLVRLSLAHLDPGSDHAGE